MTPQKQLNRHDPENGVWGDCGRAVIACLLDQLVGEVPHFYDQGVSGEEGDRAKRDWLRERGLSSVSIAYETPEQAMMTMLNTNPGIFYILFGESRNGCGHVVVCRDDEIVWDPSLDDSGIVGPEPETGYAWVEFLVSAHHEG